MLENTYFNDFNEKFDILNTDKLLSDSIKKQFFELLPNLFNYEEEGEKLNFKILFIRNLEKEKKSLPSYIFQKITTVNEDAVNIRKNIKSIAPFSLNGWDIYVSINDNKTCHFGIYKDLSSVDSLDISTILSNDCFIEIEKIDKYKLSFRNSSMNYILNLSVIKDIINVDRKTNVSNLIQSFTNQIESEKKNSFIKNISNSFFHNLDKIHGTIIIVQDKNTEIDKSIKKGILFDTPINLFDEYSNFTANCATTENISERYYSFLGILSLILNIDGITLINNNGEILGYNIFIDNTKVDTTGVVGGARKRAAYSIEKSNINGLIGIYFQSHDGDNYFKELLSNE